MLGGPAAVAGSITERGTKDERGNVFRSIGPEESSGPIGDVRIEKVSGRTTGAFQTRPARIAETVAAGTSIDLELEVLNLTGRTATFELLTARVLPGTDGTTRQLGPPAVAGRSGGTVEHWIRPATATVRLRNLQRATVPVRVAVPADAGAGGHYAAIVVRTSRSGPANEQVRIDEQIVSDVQVTVPGEIDYAARIVAADVPRLVRGRIPVSVEIRNTGNIHSRAIVRARLRGDHAWGERHRAPELLPNGTQQVRLNVTPGGPIEAGTVEVEVELEDGEAVRRVAGEVLSVSTQALAAAAGLLAAGAIVFVIVFVRRRLELQYYLELELSELDEDDPTP